MSITTTRRILTLALATALSGCSASTNSISLTSYARVAGNWEFSSTAPAASRLSALAGSLSVNGSQVSGILHPLVTGINACTPSPTPFNVSGPIDEHGNVTLTSSGFTGGTLILTGTLATNQTTLTNANYAVADGSCAMALTPASGAQYTPITGTYAGTIHSTSGTSATVSTVFTQTSQPDANGTYHLQGQATFGTSQSCLTDPIVSDSTVTGATLSATYSQTQSTAITTVTINGTFNTDATLLTLTSYAITGGSCDGDTGSGTLAKQ